MASQKAQGLPFVVRARQRAERARKKTAYPLHAVKPVAVPATEAGPIYLCPISSVPFSGQCPVHVCPGNKPGFETGGCLYLFYGRTKLDRADIMFSYRLNEKKLHDSIAYGQERVLQAVGFYRALNEARSRDILGYCPTCGVGHHTGVYTCENTALCADRVAFADHLLKTSHLNYMELQATRRDVYLIVREISRFQQLAEATHTNICEVLGVGQDLCKKLSETVGVI